LNVLHLTNYFFPEYSGTTTRLYNIICRLPFDVHVLTADRTVPGKTIPLKQEQFGNVTVNRLPLAFGAPGQSNSAWQAINTIHRDKKLLVGTAEKQPFDILHAHNSVVFGQAAAQVAGKTGRPFVFEYHGLAHESVSGFLKSVKAYYIQRTDRNVMRKCAHIVTLTDRLKEWIIRHYRIPDSRITVVPNGADVTRFAPQKEYSDKAAELKKRLGIDGKVVMYAGVMDWINGVNDLAAVAPQIIRENPEVYFIFLGGPAGNRSLSDLESKFQKNVKLIPGVPYDDMPVYYDMCDVFVVPRPSTVSTETIVPLKLVEVMAMGKPVVASDVGGLAEVIKNGENGYLFKKENAESLKKTLLDALAADNTRLGLNARQTIVAKYTWDKSAEILLNVYKKLA